MTAQHAKYENECDATASKNEEECYAMAEEYKMKLETEKSIHARVCGNEKEAQEQSSKSKTTTCFYDKGLQNTTEGKILL